MQSAEIRQKFLDFFKKRGHAVTPSASLVPQNDSSVLFTTAGMQQFKPYYIGKANALKDFGTLNTASSQKCVRTSDIEEVGDESHLTFFEMLGNFSFGGYWKKEAIEYAHEFITKDMGLQIDFVSVFGGEEGVPQDKESTKIWKLIDANIIVKKFGRKDNFWGPTGEEGPCGPTTEIYVEGIEIWNIVFNEYYQNKNGSLELLKVKGVDTGMGLERLVKVIQKTPTIFETDLFLQIISKIRELSKHSDAKPERIIADHVRTAVFMIADEVTPSNTDRGYILRRLIRRAHRYTNMLGINPEYYFELIEIIADKYQSVYSNVLKNTRMIQEVYSMEVTKFEKTLASGLKQFEKGADPFTLFTSYGFPIELTEEIAKEKGLTIDRTKFDEDMKRHQELSRQGSVEKFKK
ncbi:MAG: alanine--tRNA ligase-related protein [bacterium]|nr:alanine--tRNA ligase-related protein [bacterium]